MTGVCVMFEKYVLCCSHGYSFTQWGGGGWFVKAILL